MPLESSRLIRPSSEEVLLLLFPVAPLGQVLKKSSLLLLTVISLDHLLSAESFWLIEQMSEEVLLLLFPVASSGQVLSCLHGQRGQDFGFKFMRAEALSPFPDEDLRQEVSCVSEDILFGEVFSSRLSFVLLDHMVRGDGVLALNECKPNGV